MSATITAVEPHSIAQRRGVKPGMTLVAVNGHEITDVFDYRFYTTECELTLSLLDGERPLTVRLRKEQYDDIGLEFETYLMDKQHSCANKCVFCFIDQLPKGLRESLYFKDDDARLSFLFGNYVTLTNMSQADVDRICTMHISPINVSVHTTDPELRVRMMGNRFAGEKLAYLKVLADAGIELNTQLVLCPGLNDGAALERTLRDLTALGPALQSVALVPVGLTKHREGLYPLEPFTPETAAAVLDLADAFSAEVCADGRERFVYCADEFYLKAKRPIPEAGFYGSFHQLENGVGMLSLLRQEFLEALADDDGGDTFDDLTIACGVAAAPFLKILLDFLTKKWHNIHCNIVPIENKLFGPMITVSGLIVGRDLIDALRGRDLGSRVLLTSCMLRREDDVFLDDIRLGEVAGALGVPVVPVSNDGAALLAAITDA